MTINNKSLTFHLFPGDAIGQDESRNEYLQLIREECVDFCPCHLLVDIHQFEFPGDLHVLHMEGRQIAAAVADRLIGKGDGLLHGDQLADDRKIADG